MPVDMHVCMDALISVTSKYTYNNMCVCGDKHGLCCFQNLDSISLAQGYNYEASNENLTHCSQVIDYKVSLLTIIQNLF